MPSRTPAGSPTSSSTRRARSRRAGRPSPTRGRGVAVDDPEAFNAIPGHGIEARVSDRAVLLGNRRLMRDRGVDIAGLVERAERLEGGGQTGMFMAGGGEAGGLVARGGTPKEGPTGGGRAGGRSDRRGGHPEGALHRGRAHPPPARPTRGDDHRRQPAHRGGDRPAGGGRPAL